MLTKLILTNFRKHEHLELAFTHGLNVIRGQSEAGKSTGVEAVLYSLYGSKALRNSLKDTVTWGKPESSLRVESHFEFNGIPYSFIRSSKGAEVYREGELYATGQTEVTNIATQLLGADAATASELMIANQGNLRGALDKKPTATAEMIESLAEFSFFDKLIDTMGEKLVLGSDVSAKTRLERAEQDLENWTPAWPDVENTERMIASYVEAVKIHTDFKAKHQAEVVRLEGEVSVLEAEVTEYLRIKAERTQALDRLSSIKSKIDSARAQIQPVDLERLATLEEVIKREAELANIRKAKEEFDLVVVGGDALVWEGDMESLEAEIATTEARINTLNNEIATLQGEIKTLKNGIVTSTNCHTCGQPIKDHENVKARNAELKSQVDDKLALMGPKEVEVEFLKGDLKDLKSVKISSRPVEAFLRTYSGYVEADYSQVPAKLTWTFSEVGSADVDVESLKREAESLKLAHQTNVQAEATVCALKPLEEEAALAVQALGEEGQGPDTEKLETLKGKLAKAQEDLRISTETAAEMQRRVDTADVYRKSDQEEINRLKAEEARLNAAIAECRKELSEIGFNNALLKKVREARPILANSLWNMVLASVSSMFTSMRGEQSIVTKERDGFKVNGQTITSLSGSTLDLLGLAIRCSLVKLFVPNAPFLSLDEPAAACSDDRTLNMLAFIKNAGFPQTLLITHEAASETFADNFIELG